MESFNAKVASRSGLDAARKSYYSYMQFATACKVRLKMVLIM